MTEEKPTLPVVPAGWPQPAFALGEKVWDRNASYLYDPGEIIGMHLNQRPNLGGNCFWIYLVAPPNDDGDSLEYAAGALTREPLPEWQPAPPAPMDHDDPGDPDDPFRNSPEL